MAILELQQVEFKRCGEYSTVRSNEGSDWIILFICRAMCPGIEQRGVQYVIFSQKAFWKALNNFGIDCPCTQGVTEFSF
jgi:hypothetical protein